MKQNPTQRLQDKLDEIKLLMQYAVPAENLRQAEELVSRFKNDIIGLNLFHNFYSFLPEGEDDRIRSLKLLNRKQGTFLILAASGIGDYLYLVNIEKAEFIGPAAGKNWAKELLNFFGYIKAKALNSTLAEPSLLNEYNPAVLDDQLCPICQTGHGEEHVLGCPVEICPWCDGQLTHCNCKFTQLNKKELTRESQLEILQKEVDKKGRIPFDAEKDRLSFPALRNVQ